MPTSLNYGSTGRPPGEFHLRHSFKEISDILELLQPPFDIFSTEFANNNINNVVCYHKDGGTQPTTVNHNTSTSTYADNKEEADTAHSIHRTDKSIERFGSTSNNNNINNNIDTSSNNSNTYISCCNNNGGIADVVYEDEGIKQGGPYGTSPIGTVVALGLDNYSLNQMISNNNKKLDTPPLSYSTNVPTTTTTTTTTTSIDSNTCTTGKNDKEKALNNNRRTYKLRITLAANDNNNNNNNNTTDTLSSTDTTDANATINNTSTYDDNNKANTARRIHRTDKINKEWLASNDNNRRITVASNNNNNNNELICCYDNDGIETTINITSTYDDNNKASIIAHSIHRTDKTIEWFVISNYLIIPNELKATPHHQHHYHCKQRHQFHLEQQQKHQLFKQVYNAERMVTSIVLKLTLVAWDIWAFRNVY